MQQNYNAPTSQNADSIRFHACETLRGWLLSVSEAGAMVADPEPYATRGDALARAVCSAAPGDRVLVRHFTGGAIVLTLVPEKQVPA